MSDDLIQLYSDGKGITVCFFIQEHTVDDAVRLARKRRLDQEDSKL